MQRFKRADKCYVGRTSDVRFPSQLESNLCFLWQIAGNRRDKSTIDGRRGVIKKILIVCY